MQSSSKSLLSVILALVFVVSMTNAVALGTNEFAILPTNRVEIPDQPTDDSKRYRRNDRSSTASDRHYYRQQSYHRKMLYR